MATAEQVLKVARSQIGVCERPAGSNNVIYNTWFYGHKVSGSAYAWCATFLDWCFEKAGCGKLFPHNANVAYSQDEIVSKCHGKWIMRKNKSASTRKAYLKKAKPGDVVCFSFSTSSDYRQHIGIVESVSGNYLITIEGNTSKSGSQSNGGMVVRQRRIYTSVCSAVRPNYTGSTPDKLEPLEVDGIMGYNTNTRLQRWLKVDEDGIVGKNTVKALQRKVGLTGKAVDGEWGKQTTTALQRYLNAQIGAGLVTDGEIGNATISALQRFLNKVVTK